MYSSTARLSSAFEEIVIGWGMDEPNAGWVPVHTSLNAGRRVLVHTSLDIDPDEPTNISVLVAV